MTAELHQIFLADIEGNVDAEEAVDFLGAKFDRAGARRRRAGDR